MIETLSMYGINTLEPIVVPPKYEDHQESDNIPFVSGTQVYLPFWGSVFTSRLSVPQEVSTFISELLCVEDDNALREFMRDELARLFRKTNASNAAIFIRRGDSVECIYSADRKPPQSVKTKDGIDARKAVADLVKACNFTHVSLFVEKEKNIYRLIEE